MRKLLPYIFGLILLSPTLTFASTQVMWGGLQPGVNSLALAYMAINQIQQSSSMVAVASTTQTIMPIAGTFSNLYVTSAYAPSGTFTFTFVDNLTNTSMTCNLDTTHSTCGDSTHSITVNAGDVVSVSVTQTSGGVSQPSFVILFTPTNANETAVVANSYNNAFSASVDQSAGFSQVSVPNATTTLPSMSFADNGTLDHFYGTASSTLSKGSYNFYVANNVNNINVSTSTMEVTFNTSTMSGSDLTDSTTTVAGGSPQLFIRSEPVGTPSTRAGTFGARFVPTTAGNFEIQGGGAQITGAGYNSILGRNYVTVEASSTVPAMPMIVNALYISGNSFNVGNTGTRTVTLRDNSTNTALTCTMNNTSSCSITGQNVVIGLYDKIDLAYTQTGTPNSQYITFTMSASYLGPQWIINFLN